MSTPIDVPQNINIQVPHIEKVVQPTRPEPGNNSSNQSQLETKTGHEDEHQKIKDRKQKKRRRDRFEKSADNGEPKPSGEQEPVQSYDNENDFPQTSLPEIGRNIDLSA
ncbi:MAG: hypothetical protein GXO75_15675 [Calditrichaeota bacterium]|nr:hypothetical protein [Calditrichota bacterium]